MDKNKLAEKYCVENYCVEDHNNKIDIINIKNAFIAGCNSVIEENSKIKWNDISLYREGGLYADICKARKPLKEYLIREWYQPKSIELYMTDDNTIIREFKTIEDAKKYATEDYKKTLTNFLGL